MQFKNTTKLFYGEYPYKLVMYHQHENIDGWYTAMRKILEWMKTLPENSYRVRHMKNFQMFFKRLERNTDPKFGLKVQNPLYYSSFFGFQEF